MTLHMAHELLLLALKDDKGTLAVDSDQLRVGLVGALLVEWLLEGRLAVEDKKVVVRNESMHPDPVQESILAVIRDRQKPRSLKEWVEHLSEKFPRLIRDLENDLVAAGILRHESGKVLWVFPQHTYPTSDPSPELAIRRRIDDVVLAGSSPDARTAALISIALACDLQGELFDKSVKREAVKRAREVAKSSEGSVVGQVIEEMNVALAMIIVVAAS